MQIRVSPNINSISPTPTVICHIRKNVCLYTYIFPICQNVRKSDLITDLRLLLWGRGLESSFHFILLALNIAPVKNSSGYCFFGRTWLQLVLRYRKVAFWMLLASPWEWCVCLMRMAICRVVGWCCTNLASGRHIKNPIMSSLLKNPEGEETFWNCRENFAHKLSKSFP